MQAAPQSRTPGATNAVAMASVPVSPPIASGLRALQTLAGDVRWRQSPACPARCGRKCRPALRSDCPPETRPCVASKNSLRSLRSLRSNSFDESVHEARGYARRRKAESLPAPLADCPQQAGQPGLCGGSGVVEDLNAGVWRDALFCTDRVMPDDAGTDHRTGARQSTPILFQRDSGVESFRLVLRFTKTLTNGIDGFVRQARREPQRYP